MARLDISEINALINASDKYKALLEKEQTISDKLSLAPGLMSYEEFASQIRGGTDYDWVTPFAGEQKLVFTQPENITDQQFVLGYIFDENHPERAALRHRLSDDVPLEFLYDAGVKEPGWGQVITQEAETQLWRAISALPSALPQTAANVFAIPESLAYVDWGKVGKSLWNANPDGAFLAINKGYRDYKKGRFKRPVTGYTTGDALQMWSNMLSEHGGHAMEKHMQDPKNRAYYHWLNNASPSDLQKERSAKQMGAWAASALTSPIINFGAAGLGFVLGGPSAALTTGMTVGGIFEYSDEWNESFEYFRNRGYSIENASSMANANALAYMGPAMAIERTSLKLMLNKSMGVPAQQLWNRTRFTSGYKKMAAKMDDFIYKHPKTVALAQKTGQSISDIGSRIKKMRSKRIVDWIESAAVIGAGGAGEESLQLLAQKAIQSGYKGHTQAMAEFKTELGETASKGAFGEAAVGLAVKALGGKPRSAKSLKDLQIDKPDIRPEVVAPDIDRDSILLKTVLRLGEVDQEEQLAANIGQSDRTPGAVLGALKRKGRAILGELGVNDEEFLDAFSTRYTDPAYVEEAKRLLNIEATEVAPVRKPKQTDPDLTTEEEREIELQMEQAALEQQDETEDLPPGFLNPDELTEEPVDYNKLTIPKLNKLLETREMPQQQKGERKADLVRRLQKKDEQEAFGVPGYEDTEPNVSGQVRIFGEETELTAPQQEEEAEAAKMDAERAEADRIDALGAPEGVHPAIWQERKRRQENWIETNQHRSLKDLKEIAQGRGLDVSLLNTKEDVLDLIRDNPTPLMEESISSAKNRAYLEDLKDKHDWGIDYQAIKETKLPLADDAQEWADRVKAKLREDFPNIAGKEVDQIIDHLSGEEQAGRAFNTIAEWAKGKATVDTAPHEYFHILVKALRGHPLIEKALQDMKTEEQLTQYVGEYYANALKDAPGSLKARVKNFLRKFWAHVKKVFGRPSQYIAQKFVEGDQLFQVGEEIAVEAYKRKGAQHEAASTILLNQLVKKYGLKWTPHPTDKSRIGNIVVPENLRGKGLGTRFFESIKEVMVGRGEQIINIIAHPDSIDFWKKMGFEFSFTPLTRFEDDSPQSRLLNFLIDYGFEVNDVQELFVNLANKRVDLNRHDINHVSKVMADALSEMLSYSQDFYDIREAVKDTDRYKNAIEQIYKDNPDINGRIALRLATKEIFQDLLQSGFSERLAKELNVSDSLLKRIKVFVQKVLDSLTGANWSVIQPAINKIVDNTFKHESFVATTKKPGYVLIDFQEAFDMNPIAKDIMTKIGTADDIILTGSIAYSTQGSVYRPKDSVVHDLDFVNIGTRESAISLIKKHFKGAIEAYSFSLPGGASTDTFLVPPSGHKVSDIKRRKDGKKIISYNVRNAKNEIVGTYKLDYKMNDAGNIISETEIKTGTEAMLVDFFSGPEAQGRENPIMHDFVGSDGNRYQVQLAHYEDPFRAKLSYSRFKDIWDYNRFIPTDKGPQRMHYTIPAEEMSLGQIDYQQIEPGTEAGNQALRIFDNALNAMQTKLGKSFNIKKYIAKLAEEIPFDMAAIFDVWANQHVQIGKIVKRMHAMNDVYATREEFNDAFDEIYAAVEEDLSFIPGNDNDIRAKHGVSTEYTFMRELGINIPHNKMISLLSSVLQFLNQPTLTPQEAFDAWGEGPLQVATGYRYSDFPSGSIERRRIKQFFVRTASTVTVNPASGITPRRRNLEYRTSGELVIKRNKSNFTEKSNSTRDQNLIYEATKADKKWGMQKPVFLNLKDIYEIVTKYGKAFTDKFVDVLSDDQIKQLQVYALNNFTYEDRQGVIHGLALMSTRGDSGHMMFAPILDRHMSIARNENQIKAYWKAQVVGGFITEDQMLNFMGYRIDKDGNHVRSKARYSQKWLAGEIARYEMMRRLMPANMINNGAELFRRIKIATTPVFTSPLMRGAKAVQIATNEAERNQIVFVDRNGNEGNMMDIIAGMGNKNRTDGASIISSTFTNDMHEAFGSNPLMRLFKTVIWKADLSLAVKHEMFEPEAGMKIIKIGKDGNRQLLAEVDDNGRIYQVTAEGRNEVDILMTDDEAKISNYKSGEIIDIAGEEIGLIKYHEPKKTATFGMQWTNYVHDTDLVNDLKGFMMPRIKERLKSIFTLTGSNTFNASTLLKFAQSVHSDSPHAMTTALLEKFKLGLGMHADAMGMLNKILRTQVITPALSLNNGKGTYVDLAPDYFNTHNDDEITLAATNAHQVYVAYAKENGGTVNEAKKLSLNAINKWLENTKILTLIHRSPVPYVGGARVLRVKALHNRGGQAIVSDNVSIKLLEGDYDGDAIQVEFIPDDLATSIQQFLLDAEAANRMKAISLPSMAREIDLSKAENVRLLTQMFQVGKRSVGQIAALQNVLGQLNHNFNGIKLNDGNQIKVHKLLDQVLFPEMNDSMTMEEQLRIWLQAAVDNHKHLLLSEWNYSRDKLISRLFYIADENGNWKSEINENNTEYMDLIKPIISISALTRTIRRGRGFDHSHSVTSLLKESKKLLDYINDRQGYLMDKYDGNEALSGLVSSVEFNDTLSPLEEVTVEFARQWYGDERTGIASLAEPNKISPVEYEQDVYNTVHLQSMADLEEDIDTLMQEAMDNERIYHRELTGEEITDKDLEQSIADGTSYANQMWNSKGEGENLTGEGYASIMERIAENNEAVSWDYNPDLIRFTSWWGAAYMEMGPLGQFSATIAFLRGFAQLDQQGKLMYTVQRNNLPPVSSEPDLTVLDPVLMSKYLKLYNKKIKDIEGRSESARRVAYDPLSRILKRNC
tara:strand:- start:12242 stop:20617 length:8376 start_codon:yes stop_codon:yes gene_type:complete